jgi:AraC-like DNA-binding protein
MRSQAEVAIPFAHPVYVRSILDCLNSRGIRPASVLESAGIAWQDLSDGPQMMDFAVFRRFVAQVLQLSGDPALGLVAGSMLQPYHSPVGIAAITSDSVGQGLSILSRNARLIFAGLDFQFDEGSSWSTLQVKPLRPLCETHVFVMQSLLGAHCRLLEAMLGRPADELVVGLPYARPSGNDVPCLRYVRRVEFEQDSMLFRLPGKLLRERSASVDAKAHLQALQACRRMMSERGSGDFVQRVRLALLERLASNPELAELAAELGISGRTLVRRLAESGINYSDIKDELRKTHAAWYLQHTEMSMEAIASRLGYTDPTNFSRKFKYWYRVAPSKMRQALRGDLH